MLSIPHMIVVFIVVLVVFGPQKLPELARGLGKLMAEFRKASSDFKSAFEQEMRDIERQAVMTERKKAAEAAARAAAEDHSNQAAPSTSEAQQPVPPPALPMHAATDPPVITRAADTVPRSAEAAPDTASQAPQPSDEQTSASSQTQSVPHDTQHSA